MYRTGSATGASGRTLTGIAMGSWQLASVGMVLAGLALVALIRRPNKHRA